MSKGSWRRPATVPDDEVERRWRDVFGQTGRLDRPPTRPDPTASTHDVPVPESER